MILIHILLIIFKDLPSIQPICPQNDTSHYDLTP